MDKKIAWVPGIDGQRWFGEANSHLWMTFISMLQTQMSSSKTSTHDDASDIFFIDISFFQYHVKHLKSVIIHLCCTYIGHYGFWDTLIWPWPLIDYDFFLLWPAMVIWSWCTLQAGLYCQTVWDLGLMIFWSTRYHDLLQLPLYKCSGNKKFHTITIVQLTWNQPFHTKSQLSVERNAWLNIT